MKKRLDVLMVERKLAETRNKAQAMIFAGQVCIAQRVQGSKCKVQSLNLEKDIGHWTLDFGQSSLKPGTLVPENCAIKVKALPRFVSRGGEKLQAALDYWGEQSLLPNRERVRVEGKVCLDIGSSTGGFTDCLLQNGAKNVVAVDVGTKQMHPKLRGDPRVELYEQTHILHWTPPWQKELRVESLEFRDNDSVSKLSSKFSQLPSLVTIDVSFISLRKVLPKVLELLKFREDSLSFSELRLENFAQRSTLNAQLLVLMKPQFEVGARYIRKGIVRDVKIRQEAVLKMLEFCAGLGLQIIDHFPCPVLGAKGNQEEWIYFVK